MATWKVVEVTKMALGVVYCARKMSLPCHVKERLYIQAYFGILTARAYLIHLTDSSPRSVSPLLLFFGLIGLFQLPVARASCFPIYLPFSSEHHPLKQHFQVGLCNSTGRMGGLSLSTFRLNSARKRSRKKTISTDVIYADELIVIHFGW